MVAPDIRVTAMRALNGRKRRALDAVQAVLEVLDTLDGDPDLEAQCEDEGFDCDTEWDLFDEVPDYADGGMDQTRLASCLTTGVMISDRGE